MSISNTNKLKELPHEGKTPFGFKTVSDQQQESLTITQDQSKVFAEVVDPIENMAVQNSYFDNTILNEIEGNTLQNQLLGYLKGIRITTTYYWLQVGDGGRPHVADSATYRALLNAPVVKILNYEMTLLEGLTSSTKENGVLEVTGTAILYPKFNPSIQDRFILGMGDNLYGIFAVTNIQYKSYQKDRLYEISFSFVNYATPQEITILEGQVVDTVVFSKGHSLNSTATLLDKSTYLNVSKLQKYAQAMMEYYHNRFYNTVMETYICCEYGYYDPYLIEFITNTFEFQYVPIKPTQLITFTGIEFNRSILGTILNHNKYDIYGTYPYAGRMLYRPNVLSPYITSLVNTVDYIKLYQYSNKDHCHCKCPGIPFYKTKPPYKDILNLSDKLGDDVTYIFSSDFYQKKLTECSPSLELFVMEGITTRKIADVESLVTLLDKAFDLDDIQAFYLIPIYIWLSRIAYKNAMPTKPSSY